MKKIISVFAIALAITAIFTVSAYAEGFAVDTSKVPANVEVTPDVDSLAVSISDAVDGAEYTIILVQGNELPTAETVTNADGSTKTIHAGNKISYIDQLPAEDGVVEFTVLPLMSRVVDVENTEKGAVNTIYIGSNVKDAGLIQFAVTYEEPAPEPEYTLGDVSGDGTIDGSDALAVVAYFLKGTSFGDVAEEAGDVNVDGTVDGSDALAIVAYFLKGTAF